MSKLLIVIDMQKGFGRDAEKLIDKLNDSYRYFDTVCFSMFENKKKSLFETELNWFDFQNDEDKQLIEGINIPEGSKFLWHSTFTVFNDALKEFFKPRTTTRSVFGRIVFRYVSFKDSNGHV